MKATIMVILTLLGIYGSMAGPDKYNFIVIGAGTAGSVIASRLSEDPDISVLLIERGKDRQNTEFTDIPTQNYVISIGSGAYNNFVVPLGLLPTQTIITSEPKMLTGAGQTVVPDALGGGPAVSGLFWGRSDPADYDEWASLVGDNRFLYSNLVPYFARSENVSTADSASSLRGNSGPTQITFLGNDSRVDPYVNAQISTFGITYGQDYCATNTTKGVWNMQRDMDRSPNCTPTSGPCKRAGSYFSYLEPVVASRPNLDVVDGANVIQIVFRVKDNGEIKAVGVDYLKGADIFRARAKDEVIISAGTLNSWKILWDSGVGPADKLSALGIDVVKNLTGVGKNLQDHVFTTMVFYSPAGAAVTTPSSVRITFLPTGIFGTKIDLEIGWGLLDPALIGITTGGHLLLANIIQLRGTGANGKAELRAKSPYSTQSSISFGIDAFQLGTLVYGIKAVRQWVNQTIINTGLPIVEVAPGLAALPATASDLQILTYLGNLGTNSLAGTSLYHHSAGTCKMGPANDTLAVVDSHFRVHGISGLRVVDNSVSPVLVGTHPHATVTMLGELAAEDILNDYY